MNTYHDRPVREPIGQPLVDLHAKIAVCRYLQAREGACNTLPVLGFDQVLNRLVRVGHDRHKPAALTKRHVREALGLRSANCVIRKRNRGTRGNGLDLREEGLRGQRAVEDVRCTKSLQILGVLERGGRDDRGETVKPSNLNGYNSTTQAM